MNANEKRREQIQEIRRANIRRAFPNQSDHTHYLAARILKIRSGK